MTKVFGHTIGGKFMEFPHLCPGLGCAIVEYLSRQEERRKYGVVIEGKTWPELVAAHLRNS